VKKTRQTRARTISSSTTNESSGSEIHSDIESDIESLPSMTNTPDKTIDLEKEDDDSPIVDKYKKLN